MRQGTRVFFGVFTEDSDIPSSCGMKDEPAFKPLQGNPTLFSQGISVSTPLEAANSGSLSHTYCSGKAPLEVLVDSWPTCSIESWKSAFFSR